MTKNKKIILYIVYLLIFIASITLFVISKLYDSKIIFSIFITFFTTFFHITVRLIFANLLYISISGYCTYDRWWFREKSFEPKFFKLIKIKKWKVKLPTWNDGDFNLCTNSFDLLLKNMCKAEVYHEICMLLSFLPLLFSIPWGAFWVFFVTSLGSSLFDFLFVLIQRYNRPRVIRLMKMI